MLIMTAAAFALCFLVVNVCLLTPLSNRVIAVMGTVSAEELLSNGLALIAFYSAMLPIILIYLVALVPLLWYFSCTYRMVDYLLIDRPQLGAFGVLRESRRMMVGNKLTLFRLDLTYFFLVFASYLPSYILVGNGVVSVDGINGMLTFYLLQIPYFMAMSSFCMGRTVFYELLRFGSFKNFKYRGEDFFREIGSL